MGVVKPRSVAGVTTLPRTTDEVQGQTEPAACHTPPRGVYCAAPWTVAQSDSPPLPLVAAMAGAPGATQLTRMPWGPSSWARPMVSASSAVLLMPYMAMGAGEV